MPKNTNDMSRLKAFFVAFLFCLSFYLWGQTTYAKDIVSENLDSEEKSIQDTLNQIKDLEAQMDQESKTAQSAPSSNSPVQANPASTLPTQNTIAASAQTTPATPAPSAQLVPPGPPQGITAVSPSGNTFKVHGEIRGAMGIDSSGNAIFRRADENLNERNFQMLSTHGLYNNINTYDPAIYSRLKIVMDAAVAQSVVSMHLNLVADPWSYTGKSKAQIVTDSYGDTGKVRYLWWGNTGYTVNSIVDTLRLGDAFVLPSVKTHGNMVPAIVTSTDFGATVNVPAEKLDYSFFPVREAWVDIKPDSDLKLRIFPMAYEDQALTTDDPLRLSNNMQWWEESPWIDGWQPGNVNSGATPVDFSKGFWDKSLSFYTRDSDGQRLTALRGASLDWKPTDETSLAATVATPKTLWQDYSQFNTIAGSARLKQFIGDNFYLGMVTNMHQGYTDSERLDAENYTEGFDTGMTPFEGFKVTTEYAHSQSLYDESTPFYTTKYQGNAYFASLEYSSNPEEMINKDYFGMLPFEKTDNFFKSKLYFARMDDNFESSLSNYNNTNEDSFWSEHLTFYPSNYRYLPGVTPGMSEYDLEPFALGNGINYGQRVLGLRGDTNLDEGKLQGMGDMRYIVENGTDRSQAIYRTQWAYKVNDRLTTKFLAVEHDLPKTQGVDVNGVITPIDPFVTASSGQPLINNSVVMGKNPSLTTASVGARYQLTDWAAWNGVYEFSNDVTLATNDFPQGVLNSSSFYTYTQNGKTYRAPIPFLYDQGYFDQPPYYFRNIFKTGLELTPQEKWHIYIDYTRNPNEFAFNIDDNMNHYGIETSYLLTPKIGFFARYMYSQGYDINRVVNNHDLKYRGYNDFFFEARMVLPKDMVMSLQYGVGPSYNIQTSATDPNLTYYASTVVQTQHIVRLVFDKKF